MWWDCCDDEVEGVEELSFKLVIANNSLRDGVFSSVSGIGACLGQLIDWEQY